MTLEQEKKFYTILVELFYKYDPAYLKESVEADEYSPEASALMMYPEYFDNRETLGDAIHLVCAKYFGADNIAPRDDMLYGQLAREILAVKGTI
jgi:hypothetical protein